MQALLRRGQMWKTVDPGTPMNPVSDRRLAGRRRKRADHDPTDGERIDLQGKIKYVILGINDNQLQLGCASDNHDYCYTDLERNQLGIKESLKV